MQPKRIVVFCGSHAPVEKHKKLAYNTGKALAAHGFITVTGGGAGLMEQVNKGAHDAGGVSHGLYPEVNVPNGYLHYSKAFETFTARHDALLSYGDAYVALPGGLGTILEIVDITQKKKFNDIPPDRPLLLLGDYFDDLHSLFSAIARQGYIKEDLHRFYTHVKEIDDMINLISQ